MNDEGRVRSGCVGTGASNMDGHVLKVEELTWLALDHLGDD